MDKVERYRGFRIRAYEERPGRWLAEARKTPIHIDSVWITTPSGYLTSEAAIDVIKQIIDNPITR